MFFFIFFYSVLSYFEKLTIDNYTSLINESQKFPVFALLQSRWCSHCMELKPTWRRVQEHYENDTRFYFVDISCDSDNELCNKFADSGTPRIFWCKSGIEAAERFVNSYTYEEFIIFIEKRLAQPITDIYNHTQYLEFLKQNEEQSIFSLQEYTISDSSNSEIQKSFEKIANEFDSYPCRFINMKYNEFESKESDDKSQAILQFTCPWTNTTDRLVSLLNEKNMRAFINLYSFPPLYDATNVFLKAQVKTHRPFLLYYDNDKVTFYGQLVKLTSKFPRWFKTGVINCADRGRVCRVFGFTLTGGHEFVIVLPHKNIYYKFEGEISNITILNWVKSVLDGNERALGPGAGFKGFWFNLKIQMKKPKFWKRLIINLSIGIPILVLLIKGLLKCIELGTPPEYEDDENEKKISQKANEEGDTDNDKCFEEARQNQTNNNENLPGYSKKEKTD